MEDGSTCRHTVSGSSSGTTLTENPCGSASSVQFELPDHSNYDSYDFCIYSIGVACVSELDTTAPALSFGARDMPPSPGQPIARHPIPTAIHGLRKVNSPTILPRRLPFTLRPREISVVSPCPSSMWTAVGSPLTQWTTSTVYTTSQVTITSCAPTVTNCPADSTKVVASTIAISTTVCPATHTTPRKSKSTRVGPRPIASTVSSQRAGSTSIRPVSVLSLTRSLSGSNVRTTTGTPAHWTTSTIYTTSEVTVTSCAVTVTDCPADSTRVLTSTIAISTTICPVTKSSAASSTSVSASGLSSGTQSTASSFRSTSLRGSYTSSSGPSASSSASAQWTTSTIYTTSEVTVTSCAASITNCPASSTRVVTSTIAISTTVCPVTETTPGTSESTAAGSSKTSSVPASPTQTHTRPDSTASGPSVSSASTVAKSGTLSLTTSTQPFTDTLSQWTISTIYTTSEITVTSCAPTVTHCPADSTRVVTSTVAISTTICPVTETQPGASQHTPTSPVPSKATATDSGSGGTLPTLSSPSSSAVVTSRPLSGAQTTASATDTPTSLKNTTIYTTKEITVTSCAPTVTDCPASSTRVITSTVVISTTIAPASQTSARASGTLSATSILSSVSSQPTIPISAPLTTSTHYTTPETVAASCATALTDCRSDSTQVETSTIAFSTTQNTASGSFSGGSEPTSMTLTSSSSFSVGPTIPPAQPTTTSLTLVSGSAPSLLPPSDGSPAPLESTVTFVAYTTTTVCSAKATVFVEASEDVRSSSTIPVFSVPPISIIYIENSVGSTTIPHAVETTQTSPNSSAEAGQAGSTPTASSLTTVTTYPVTNPVTNIPVPSEPLVSLSSIGFVSHLLGEALSSPATSVFSRPTTGGSSLALQCREDSLFLAPECASKSDTACVCLSAEFARAVISCISTWGSTDTEVQIANADFIGMCAQWVPDNFATLDPSTVTSISVPLATTSHRTYAAATLQGITEASAAQSPSTSQSTWAEASSSWAVNMTEMSSSSAQASSRLQATTTTPYYPAGSANSSLNRTFANSASNRCIKHPFLLGPLGILIRLAM